MSRFFELGLYAYLMTRDPVRQETSPNTLAFPFNIRPLMAGWHLVFLRKGELAPVAEESAEWNRGRYLVEGLGHCGACHTPRNGFGAEASDKHLAGGPVVDGWYAYPINANSPAPTKWDADSLATYLRHGAAAEHGVARGPMAQVTARLSQATDEDIRAMAVYLAAVMGGGPPGAGAVHPRAGARVGTLRPRDGDASQGGARLRRQDRRLGL